MGNPKPIGKGSFVSGSPGPAAKGRASGVRDYHFDTGDYDVGEQFERFRSEMDKVEQVDLLPGVGKAGGFSAHRKGWALNSLRINHLSAQGYPQAPPGGQPRRDRRSDRSKTDSDHRIRRRLPRSGPVQPPVSDRVRLRAQRSARGRGERRKRKKAEQVHHRGLAGRGQKSTALDRFMAGWKRSSQAEPLEHFPAGRNSPASHGCGEENRLDRQDRLRRNARRSGTSA